jgi:hypothetical protein
MPTLTESTRIVTPDRKDRSGDAGNGSGGNKDRGGGSSLERVTVNLTTRSVAAMETITHLTGDTKTEAINKALQFYAHIEEFLASGGALYMRDPGSNEMERIKIF